MALHDEDERREVTYEAASKVLEAQRETLSDVDTKAVRTVKITVVLLGILGPAWRIEPGLFEPAFATAGGIALLGSLVAGTVTYNESDVYLGPGKEYVRRLADGDIEAEDWKRHLLYNLSEWIASNNREIRAFSRLLTLTQVLLICGLALLGLSIGL